MVLKYLQEQQGWLILHTWGTLQPRSMQLGNPWSVQPNENYLIPTVESQQVNGNQSVLLIHFSRKIWEHCPCPKWGRAEKSMQEYDILRRVFPEILISGCQKPINNQNQSHRKNIEPWKGSSSNGRTKLWHCLVGIFGSSLIKIGISYQKSGWHLMKTLRSLWCGF